MYNFSCGLDVTSGINISQNKKLYLHSAPPLLCSTSPRSLRCSVSDSAHAALAVLESQGLFPEKKLELRTEFAQLVQCHGSFHARVTGAFSLPAWYLQEYFSQPEQALLSGWLDAAVAAHICCKGSKGLWNSWKMLQESVHIHFQRTYYIERLDSWEGQECERLQSLAICTFPAESLLQKCPGKQLWRSRWSWDAACAASHGLRIPWLTSRCRCQSAAAK